MARKQTVCGHEPHHSKGLCRRCTDHFRKQRQTNIAPPDIPDELRAKVEAAGRLVPREDKRFSALPPTASGAARQLAEEVQPAVKVVDTVQRSLPYDTSDPQVASYIASSVARHLHDYKAAVRALRPDLTPADQAELAHKLSNDPNIAAALEGELAKLGLTDEAKQKFVGLLWSAATDLSPQRERDRLQAWRLLSRAFLPAENPIAKNGTPANLPIVGLDAGLEKMGLSDSVVAAIPPTQLSNFEEEIEKDQEEQ